MLIRNSRFHIFWLLIILLILFESYGYEKTLRKIVRDQAKMVPRRFSDPGNSLIWANTSIQHNRHGGSPKYSGLSQGKTFYHNRQKQMATIFSAIDTDFSQSAFSILKNPKVDGESSGERAARNTREKITIKEKEPHTDSILFQNEIDYSIKNLSYPTKNPNNFYQISAITSLASPTSMDKGLQNVIPLKKDKVLYIPEDNDLKNSNRSLLVQSTFVATPEVSKDYVKQPIRILKIDSDEERADFLLQGVAADADGEMLMYNVTITPQSCSGLKESSVDIDAQEKFSLLDIEPSWISKKSYWNHIFDSRYEALMRNPKWPPLQVILVPISHVDTIWRRTFDEYHNNNVEKILSNLAKKIQFYRNFTFTWNEISHLSHWWKRTTPKNRAAIRRSVKEHRLEITTGNWVQPDEATSHLFGLVHQLLEGHQWLKQYLNYKPRVGWLTNSVTHSPTMPYLLSACEITNLVFTNVHYSWEQYLAEYQHSDFLWFQNWDKNKSEKSYLNEALNKIGPDRLPDYAVLSHYLPFNSDGFKACGPNKKICRDFNFAYRGIYSDVNSYNVKEKAELLLEQYSKAGTVTPHNVIIAPIGGHFYYENQSDFDYQYNNYQSLADFVNINSDIYKATIEFGTPINYFKSILLKHQSYPTLKGDFFNFADLLSGTPAYWTGFFTTRPKLKILLRRLQSALRSTEILFSFGLTYKALDGINASQLYDLLTKARETVARLQDRNVVGGTLSGSVLKSVIFSVISTVKDCWFIQEKIASLLTIKPGNKETYMQKYVYREGEFMSVLRSIVPGDQIYVFNSLSHERTETIELITRNPNIRIINHKKKDLMVQINPVWKYGTNNIIKISRRFFKINFVVVISPMTLELFKIKETYDASKNIATIYCLSCIIDEAGNDGAMFPFSIQSIETGDIQLESFNHRIIFDEFTGFMKTVIEKETNTEKSVKIDYGAFSSSHVNSGMYLFNTNVTKPVQDILMPYRVGTKSKIVMITSGPVATELTTIYGRLLQHIVKVFNLIDSPLSNAIYIESKVDYEVSPKYRELELFLSIQTDISNGIPPKLYTDDNAFQYTGRTLNISRRVESNMYPMTNMAFIQDRQNRLTIITDHAQGVTVLQEGQIIVLLDRRILLSDGRGTNEGLADSSATNHRHYVLLETLTASSKPIARGSDPLKDLSLPSLSALYLSNTLNYLIDVFMVNKNNSDLSYYKFFPMVKSSFPCDVAVLNFRATFNSGVLNQNPPTTLLILHKQTYSCVIQHAVHLNCDGENQFSIKNIFRHVKEAYKTNLCGTNKGVEVNYLDQSNFPSMELVSLRIKFR